MKDLKVMLKQVHADGLLTNLIFQHKDFKKFSETVDSVYLTNDELQTIFNLDLNSTSATAEILRNAMRRERYLLKNWAGEWLPTQSNSNP